LNFTRFEKIREFSIPTEVNSASLHPDKKYIVAGGMDFKLYKFHFETLEEIGEFFNIMIYEKI